MSQNGKTGRILVQEPGEKLKQRKKPVFSSNQKGGNGAAPQGACIDHRHCCAPGDSAPHPRRLWLRWGVFPGRGSQARASPWMSQQVPTSAPPRTPFREALGGSMEPNPEGPYLPNQLHLLSHNSFLFVKDVYEVQSGLLISPR